MQRRKVIGGKVSTHTARDETMDCGLTARPHLPRKRGSGRTLLKRIASNHPGNSSCVIADTTGGEESSTPVNTAHRINTGYSSTHLLHGDVLDVSATEDDVIVDLRAGRDLRPILLAPFGAERSHCGRKRGKRRCQLDERKKRTSREVEGEVRGEGWHERDDRRSIPGGSKPLAMMDDLFYVFAARRLYV